MSGRATLTMKRSRLAMTTPAHTIARTRFGDASPRRRWLRDLIVRPPYKVWLRDAKVSYHQGHERHDPHGRQARAPRRLGRRHLPDRAVARRRADEVGDARAARGLLRRDALRRVRLADAGQRARRR